jgi:Tfp pilus assembly protein PilF
MNRKGRRRLSRVDEALDYEALYRAAGRHHELVQVEQARAIYDRVLENDNPHALELFGELALRYYEFERAAALIAKAVSMGQATKSIHSQLGLAQTQVGDTDAAERSLREALRVDDDDTRAWINLGLLYRDENRLADEIDALENAVARDPTCVNAYLHLADAELRDKQAEEARENVRVALEIEPRSTWGLALEAIALSELGEVERLNALTNFDALVRIVDAEAPAGFPDLEHFHRSLGRHISRHQSLRSEPFGFSTRNGSQTLGNLLHDPDRVVRTLEDMIDRVMAGVFDSLPSASDHPQVLRRPERIRLEGWGVQLETGGHQESHIHRDGWWSAVYYVDLGGVVDEVEDAGCEGWLELGSGPRALYARGSTPATLLVRPEPGRFVVFPSYMWHRTIPFRRSGTRVSFAFDVIPA